MPSVDDYLLALFAVRNGMISAQAALESSSDEGGFLAAARKLGLKEADLSALQQQAHEHRARNSDPARTWTAGPQGSPEVREMPLPSRGPRYMLGDELGRGGLGRVVSAFDGALDREVAVKLVIDTASPALVERFGREAKLTARLDHPNIVPVHDFGELAGTDGKRQVFLSMKRVHGRDLASVLTALRKDEPGARETWTRARLLGVFQGVCHGAAYAHAKGIIHRDLKPANVMLGEYGETLVVDWGLAKVVEDRDVRRAWRGDQATLAKPGEFSKERSTTALRSPELTQDGEIIGTPKYMPPEQAAGKLSEMDSRSDIWSLGAILYELVTLRPPFDGADGREVLDKILRHDLTPPSRVADVPAELEAIILHAMAPLPANRFASALDLNHEIQLFLEGAKEKDRARAEALRRAAEGYRALQLFRDLRGVISLQAKAVADLAAEIKPHVPPAEKRVLWDAEDRLRATKDERLEAWSQAAFSFSQALAADPACAPAADGICELFLERCLEAESARDGEELVLQRSLLTRYDHSGRFGARFDAPGRLELRAFAYDCDCLKPVVDSRWSVSWSRNRFVSWVDGVPRPDVELTELHRPVPELELRPAGIRWGHRASCPLRELKGVEVRIARYEERDRRLVALDERVLGSTPLPPVELPQGSYLCHLRWKWPDGSLTDQALPVRIDRDATWSQDVTLYSPSVVPQGFVVMPGGSFVFGGLYALSGREAMCRTTDVFVAREAVTLGEYLEFLRSLLRDGREDEFNEMRPVGTGPLFRRRAGSDDVEFCATDSDLKAYARESDHPVHYIDWPSANAFAEWRSKRDGRVYSLLHEEEFEKAARGVDRRIVSCGNVADASFLHTSASFPDGHRIMPIETFPADISPYGVHGTCGAMKSWCLNAMELAFRSYLAVRGGSWVSSPVQISAAQRSAFTHASKTWEIGLRLACRPFAWGELPPR